LDSGKVVVTQACGFVKDRLTFGSGREDAIGGQNVVMEMGIQRRAKSMHESDGPEAGAGRRIVTSLA
jgi:hypothetical protein